MQSPKFHVSILVLFLPILIIILVLRLLAWWFCGTPNSGNGVSLTLLLAPGTPFSPVGLLFSASI